jgi:hypothetical protein
MFESIAYVVADRDASAYPRLQAREEVKPSPAFCGEAYV